MDETFLGSRESLSSNAESCHKLKRNQAKTTEYGKGNAFHAYTRNCGASQRQRCHPCIFSLAATGVGLAGTLKERAAIAAAEAEARTPVVPPRRNIFHSGLRTTEPASENLLRAVVGKGRTIHYALPGSEELRYLDSLRANANVGGATMTDILLRQNPTKVEVPGEFLHGTQCRIGVIDRLGVQGAEVHVKEFMLRHQRLLGIAPDDVRILEQMCGR